MIFTWILLLVISTYIHTVDGAKNTDTVKPPSQSDLKTNAKVSTSNGGVAKNGTGKVKLQQRLQTKMSNMREKIPDVQMQIETQNNRHIVRMNGNSYKYDKLTKIVPSSPSAKKFGSVKRSSPTQPKPSGMARAKQFVTNKYKRKPKPNTQTTKKPRTPLKQKIKQWTSRIGKKKEKPTVYSDHPGVETNP